MKPPGSADVPVGMDDDNDRTPREWYSRGYLPHRDAGHLLQSVTFRLADSLPREKLDKLTQELASVPMEERDAERRKRIEAWLDAGAGCCALRHPEVANFVQEALLRFHGERY